MADILTPIAVKTTTAGDVVADINVGPTGASALEQQGTAADGVPSVGNPLLMGGDDGTNVQKLKTDTGGQLETVVTAITPPTGASATEIQGPGADGATQVGDPIVIAGNDSTNIQTIRTDTDGHMQVDVLTGGGSPAAPTAPIVEDITSAALAALGTVNLDTSDVGDKDLIQLIISSSVPLRVELNSVLNAVETIIAVFFIQGNDNFIWNTPHETYVQVGTATGGVDGFRATVKNMDPDQAADVYCSFFYQNS